MSDRLRRMSDEVDTSGRVVAIEFGEGGRHPAADLRRREGLPRRGEDFFRRAFPGWSLIGGAAPEIPGGHHEYRLRPESMSLRDIRDRRDFSLWFFPRNDDVERKWPTDETCDLGKPRCFSEITASVDACEKIAGAMHSQPGGKIGRLIDVGAREKQPDFRHRILGPAQIDRNETRWRPLWGRVALNPQSDALVERLARADLVGKPTRERPHVGLKGGVGPVAMVLHLKGIPLHPNRNRHTRHGFVAKLPYVKHWLFRIDELRKFFDRRAAGGMPDRNVAADYAIKRMEHHEASPIGIKAVVRLAPCMAI